MQEVSRPDQIVLPESAIIPAKNIISPAPNHFTDQLLQNKNYYFNVPGEGEKPGGVLTKGTKILVVNNAGKFCWVADSQGLYVVIATGDLAPLNK